MLLHVDDMLSSGPKKSMDELRDFLFQRFRRVKESRNPENFNYLGMSVRRERGERKLLISQPKYIKDIVESLDISATREMPYNQDLLNTDTDEEPLTPEERTLFASATMKMMYITRARPDIRLPLAFLTMRTQRPTRSDMEKLIMAAQSLNTTRNLEMVVHPETMTLVCSSDASFAPHADQKSQTGGVMRIGQANAPIHVTSKKQKIVTCHSHEAEVVAVDAIANDALWMRNILTEFGFPQVEPTVIEQDKKSCILVANRGPGIGKSRSLDVKYFWITEKIAEGKFMLQYIPTDKLIADGLTKPLPLGRFK